MSEKKQKNRAVVGLMAMVGVFFVVLVFFSAYTVKVFEGGQGSSSVGFGGGSKDKIGVIEVTGAIMDSKTTVELIQKAEEKESIKAIIMRVNSPGGAVAPTQEIYNEIRRIDSEYTTSKGKSGKPIYASFGSMAASGGYYLGAATRRICSLPGTITGSIGVIMQFMDLSKLYELARVNPQTIKAGRYKDVGQPNRALTREEKDLLDSMIKEVHTQFISDIKKTRAKKIKGDINELAQGQIYSGQSAHAAGLVDELSGLWGCARNIHKELKLDGKLDLEYIEKKKKLNVFDIVNNLEEASSFIKQVIQSDGSPVMMYK